MQIHSEELSFSQALKNIKTTSQELLLSSRSTKEGTLSRYKSESLIGSFLSPKAKLIKRTNTTLRDIVKEFTHLPNNEYVLRLGFSQKKLQGEINFDEWICSVNSRQKYNRGYYHEEQKKIQDIREEIQLQVNEIRLKTQAKFVQIQQYKFDLNSNNQVKKASEVPKKHKFSFSGFFEESQSTNLGDRQKGEVITKVSIMNQSYLSDEVIQDQIIRTVQGGQKSQVLQVEQHDKENENPNCSVEVKGLQFSKNRRYKTTKKKRKHKD